MTHGHLNIKNEQDSLLAPANYIDTQPNTDWLLFTVIYFNPWDKQEAEYET